MSKFIPLIGFTAAVAFCGTAFAQVGPDPMAGAGQTSVSKNGQVTCHHDGEVIQGPNGTVVCHLNRHDPRLHYYSARWLEGVQDRSGASGK